MPEPKSPQQTEIDFGGRKPDEVEGPKVLDAREAFDAELEDFLEEPEVEVESSEKPVEPSKPTPQADTEVSKALATIESLRRENDELRRRPTEASRPEPEIEFVEPLPGVRLPKDKTQWPIKIKDTDLVALGWNDNPADAIQTLANVFYEYVASTLLPASERLVLSRLEGRASADRRVSTFESMFPDLAPHRDLMEVVEIRARREGADTKYSGYEYFKEIGRRGRTRLAELRGMTLADYEASLSRPTTPPARSRATMGGSAPSRRSDPNTGLNPQQKEMADLLPWR